MVSDVSAAELMVRFVASLGMVLAIILVLARVVRNRGGLRLGRTGDGPRLDVLDRTTLSRNASVAVVRVGGRALIVGITDQQVNLLAEAPELVDRYEISQINQVEEQAIHKQAIDMHDMHDMQVEAKRTEPPAEHQVWPDAAPAPKPARMNFFEALRESTVRRS